MALKRSLNEDERLGLTNEEINLAEKYLRQHKTRGQVPKSRSHSLKEMYYLGCSFEEIHHQFPHYSRAQIILSCALQGWAQDRELLISSMSERVQSKVVKSVIDQVDFLTSMLAVANTENLKDMQEYIKDPENNPKPDMRIKSIKDYKEVLDSLNKLITAAQSDNRVGSGATKNLLTSVQKSHPSNKVKNAKPSKELTAAEILEAELAD